MAGLAEAVVGFAGLLAQQARAAAYSMVEPKLYPPGHARLFTRLAEALVLAALAASIAGAVAAPVHATAALALEAAALALMAAAWLAPRVWRAMVGAGVNREMPSLLAYVIPYASSARYLADVIAALPRSFFRWTRYEADRLRYLLDLGYDPVAALQELASTTPSRKLREALNDYIHAQKLGAPRSTVTMRLLERAVEEARSAWRSYTDLGRGLVEAATAIVIAAVAMAPMALLSGTVNVGLLAAPLAAAPALGLLMLVSRPSLGDYRGDMAAATVALLGALASAATGLSLGVEYEFAVLAAFTVAAEALAMVEARREEAAYAAFREAVEEARYGRALEAALARAAGLAKGVVAAIVEAARVAGRLGVGEALANLYRVVEEARSARLQARGQGLVLAILAAAAVPVAVYTLRSIAALEGVEILAGSPRSLEAAAQVMVALSPLAPLPAAILMRGWRPGLAPSLASLAAAWAALHF